jgi:dTDP-4-amino-4,6-dideoxygalactose transaminase
VRRILNFGIDNAKRLSWNRLGSNYKISDISAAYILSYLEDNFDNIVEHHKELYKYIKDNINYKMYPNFSDDYPVLSCFCFLDDKFDEEYVDNMVKKGIFCRKYYNPLIETKYAMEIYNRILCYPCNLDVDGHGIKLE